MKIDITTLQTWLGNKYNIDNIINKLNYIGLETNIENDLININIPFNRNNINSLFDIINELSGTLNIDHFLNKIELLKKKSIKSNFKKINISIKKFCYFYSAIILENFNNKIETPQNIKNTLNNNNIKLNNFIVDILNYTYLITGQPLHVYDTDKTTTELNIKKIKNNRIFTTINDTIITLSNNTPVVINTQKEILAIPGIIGSKKYKVDNTSKNILIECALFCKDYIKKISEKYKIHTYAAKTFSNGININFYDIALNFLIETLYSITNNLHITKIFEYKNKEQIPLKKITLRKKNIYKTTGFIIDKSEIEDILKKKNIEHELINDTWKIQIPYNRGDIETEKHLISEIIKIHGYEKIPLIPIKTNVIPVFNNFNNTRNTIINYLFFNNFHEVINYTFASSSFEKLISENKNLIYLKNPLSEKMDVLRSSLLQGLLKNAAINLNRGLINFKIFEIGNVWCENSIQPLNKLACICTEDSLYLNVYNENKTFYMFKNLIKNIYTDLLKLVIPEFIKTRTKFLNKEISAEIFINEKKIGLIGLINDHILEHFSIKKKLYFLECTIENLHINKNNTYTHISKFPKVNRDISFTINNKIEYAELIKYIISLQIKYLIKTELLYIYQTNEILKTITIRLIFQSTIHTLTDLEINEAIHTIITNIKEKFQAQVKGI